MSMTGLPKVPCSIGNSIEGLPSLKVRVTVFFIVIPKVLLPENVAGVVQALPVRHRPLVTGLAAGRGSPCPADPAAVPARWPRKVEVERGAPPESHSARGRV